jgi:AcrR family transcriptional regulator
MVAAGAVGRHGGGNASNRCVTALRSQRAITSRRVSEKNLGRPKQPLISRETAVAAAIEVIDEDGLDAFSLGSVAKRMGVKSPSLYYHFHDKAELLAQVARHILLDVQFAWDGPGEWDEKTILLCVETRRAMLKHPNAAPLLLQFFPRHLLLGAYEQTVISYPRRRELHMAILEGVERFTFGSTLFAASALARGIPPMPSVDPTRYPNLARSVAANPFDDEGNFIQALKIFFAGVKVMAGDAA